MRTGDQQVSLSAVRITFASAQNLMRSPHCRPAFGPWCDGAGRGTDVRGGRGGGASGSRGGGVSVWRGAGGADRGGGVRSSRGDGVRASRGRDARVSRSGGEFSGSNGAP